ncbi:T9SS type A sorting domain-containing protein, partial [Flammeovirga aprica]
SISFSLSTVVLNQLDAFIDQDKVVFKLKELGEATFRVMATDQQGSSTVLEIPIVVLDNESIEKPTSTELEELMSVKVYPNPARDIIDVECPTLVSGIENIKLTLLTLEGKVQMTEIINNGKTSIDVSSLPQGIYILTLENNAQTTIKKVIIN